MVGGRSRDVGVGAQVKWSLGEVIVWAQNGKSIEERVAPATRNRAGGVSVAVKAHPFHSLV